MRIPTLSATALISALTLAVGAEAQSLADAATPKELPPASFNGRQYVDSAGCVYVRAGFDGAVQWVPRVTRQRNVICGQTPTFGGTRTAQAAPAADPATAPQRAAQPTRVAAAPQPRVVRRIAPAPALPSPGLVIAQTAPPAQTAPASTQRIVAPAEPTVAPRRVASTACKGVSATSARYINSTGVRCGPQAQDPSSGSRIVQGSTSIASAGAHGGSIRITSTNGTQRIVPVTPPIPEGYRRVWDDGRLNPNRGLITTASNTAQNYDLAWTSKAPHLLFDRRTGLVVGDQFPGVAYPNLPGQTSASTKNAAPLVTATAGVSRATTKSVAPRALSVAPKASVPAKVVASHRHIQVATFASMAQAQSAAQPLANAGIPTRIGKFTRNGQAMQVVVLGPFNSQGALQAALRTARSYGHTGAMLRK